MPPGAYHDPMFNVEKRKKFTDTATRVPGVDAKVAGFRKAAALSSAKATPVFPSSADRPPRGRDRYVPWARAVGAPASTVVAAAADTARAGSERSFLRRCFTWPLV